jgi:hypothetical protein
LLLHEKDFDRRDLPPNEELAPLTLGIPPHASGTVVALIHVVLTKTAAGGELD